jgi:hypothetical protein
VPNTLTKLVVDLQATIREQLVVAAIGCETRGVKCWIRLQVSDNDFEKKASITYLDKPKKQRSLLCSLQSFRIIGSINDGGIDAFIRDGTAVGEERRR